MELYHASKQWSERPDDQRFLSLEDLHTAVLQRKLESWTSPQRMEDMRIIPTEGGDLIVRAENKAEGKEVDLKPTNWAFGQLCQSVGAPASYMKKLPAELAAINLQWGMEADHSRDDSLVLAHEDGDHTLTAMTSTTYGRIWDAQVVDAIIRANQDGYWKVPAASYSTSNPKRATTLYASDRDVFLFLVDEERPVTFGDETLFRGFMAWNSEVGKSSFGLTTFLYRYVCDNRIVWGATDVKELRIRHTGGAPDRFAYEGRRFLYRYANESTLKIEGQVKAAQEKEVAKDAKGVEDWLAKRGFTKKLATAARAKAEEEPGSPRSIWNIVQGVTAEARSIAHTDTRVDLERKAGDLLKYAAA
jgi:hypothetical protein